MPKQFVKLFDGQSLFQLTVGRNHNICNRQYIVSNAEQYFLALDQLIENRDCSDTYTADQKEIRNTHIRIGIGIEISIKELVETIKAIVGYQGELFLNSDKPDGTMGKLTGPSKFHSLGWKHQVELEEEISKVCLVYIEKKSIE